MSNKGMWGLVVGLVVVIALVVMVSQGVFSRNKGFQAVFLNNGQLYFGKLSKENSSTMVLKDVFYLRVQRQVQPADGTDQPAAAQQVQLVKLGGEIHGPSDMMRINRENVLYIEDLKEDKDDKGEFVSRVRKSIDTFEKNGGNATPSPSPSAS